MRGSIFVVVGLLGLGVFGRAQLVTDISDSCTVLADEQAYTYNSTDINGFLYRNFANSSSNFGTACMVSTSPWSAVFLNGVASSSGATGLSRGDLVNGLNSATLSTFLAAGTQLSTTQTDAGPYPGVGATEGVLASSSMTFTLSQNSLLSLSGSFAGVGDNLVYEMVVNDETAGTSIFILRNTAGGTLALNQSASLVAGDTYDIGFELISNPYYDVRGSVSTWLQDSENASANLAATFTATPAPEPLTVGLLGVGAVALLRRKCPYGFRALGVRP